MNAAAAETERNAVAETCVQRLMRPDPAINSEDSLFFHASKRKGKVGFDTASEAYFLLDGGELRFDAYFNIFPAHLYDLDEHEVVVEIEGDGEAVVEVLLARHQRSGERLARTRIEFTAGVRRRIRLPNISLDGVVYLAAIGLKDTFIREVNYIVIGPVRQEVSLTGVITTFKRDAAVQQTGKRLQRYFDDNPDLADNFSLVVIDNGGETNSIAFDRGEVIRNPNLGGAGGFTRGLMVAVDRGQSSHVLFMDDDASFFPESLRRTISVLRFAKMPNLAISGAMITEAHKWRMWENAATFDQCCRPIDKERDLRRFDEVLAMSISQPRNMKNKYAGWWYFCFPISAVKVWPFPFFVRGDDSYFSLSNNFDIVTVPGVVAHQEDFFTKQTPLTLYLDMRYHIVHHLTFDEIELGKRKLRRMVERYFYRFNNSYHYESAQAINLAVEDVLAGDAFWEQNVDMADKRNQIASLIRQEKIQAKLAVDLSRTTPHAPKRNKGRWLTLLRRITLNGHRLPKWLFYSKAVLFPLDVRAIEHDTFLRPYSVTMDAATGRGYICKIDRNAYFNNRKRFKSLVDQLEREYEALRKRYAGAASTLTAREAWERRLAIRKP